MRLIVGGPGRDPMFDAERLPGHGLEITLILARPTRKMDLPMLPTPRRSDGPDVWLAYRMAGARAVIRSMTEVRVAVDGLVTRSLRPAWLLHYY